MVITIFSKAIIALLTLFLVTSVIVLDVFIPESGYISDMISGIYGSLILSTFLMGMSLGVLVFFSRDSKNTELFNISLCCAAVVLTGIYVLEVFGFAHSFSQDFANNLQWIGVAIFATSIYFLFRRNAQGWEISRRRGSSTK